MDKEYAAQFYERMIELRKKKQVTARAMSELLGASSGYISSIERGKVFPSFPMFFQICDFFDITPEMFFAQKQEKAPQINNQSLLLDGSTINREMFKEWNSLGEAEQEHLLTIMKDLNQLRMNSTHLGKKLAKNYE